MIIYTPLKLPNIEPDSWEVFWNIWNRHSDVAIKKSMNIPDSKSPVGSNDTWIGLDIFKHWNYPTAWECPYVDISKELPLMYSSFKNLNIRSLYKVRLLQSIIDIKPHSDDNADNWKIRGYLHYTDPNPQWYFTRPGDVTKTYAKLPTDTQWFAYNDKYAWHGSDYNPNHKKILIQLYFFESVDKLVKSNIETYKDYIIEYV
jgi:hypothetical protein